MKKLLAVILLLTAQAFGSISFQQIYGTNNSSGSATCVVSVTASNSGELLVGAIQSFTSGGTPTITISDGSNTWAIGRGEDTDLAGAQASWKSFYVKNNVGGALTVTFSRSIAQPGACFVARFSGADNSSPLDGNGAFTGGQVGTAMDSGAPSPNITIGDLVVGYGGTELLDATISAGTGFTLPSGGTLNGGGQTFGFVYMLSTASATQHALATISSSTTTGMSLVAFKAAASSGGGITIISPVTVGGSVLIK